MKRFFRDAALMPNQALVIALSVTSGMAQAFGITLFIPLFQIMQGEADSETGLMVSVRAVFARFGLEPSLPLLLLAVTVLIVGGIGLNYFRRVMLFRSMLSYVEQSRDRLISGYLNANWPFLAGRASGVTLNQLLVQTFRAGTALMQQTYAISDFVQMAILLLASAILSPVLFALTVGFGIVAVLLVMPLRRRALVIGRDQVAAEEKHSFYVVDYLKNLRLIKATAIESRVFAAIRQLQDELHDAIMKKQNNLAQMEVASQTLPIMILSAILLIGWILPGADLTMILVFGMLLVRAAPLLVRIQQLYQTYVQEIATIDSIRDAIDTIAAESEVDTEGLPSFPGLDGDIVLEKANYRFPGADGAALVDVDITIPYRKFTAVVGRSGAGKSTLLEVLCRLRKLDTGSISVDGRNIEDFAPYSWRRQIGYVTQETIIFNGSVRENLLIVRPEATEDDMWRALEAASLNDVIAETDDGLDTFLGEGGVRFSGGQRQRLALARALINNPAILILDEATSDLDPVSEGAVKEAIEKLAHKMTIVAVAHRLDSIRNADRIYMLDHGAVIGCGTFDELVRDNEAFADFQKTRQTGQASA